MKVKEESEKADLKLNIQKMKIMASGAITSWLTDGGKVETVTDFIFVGSKVTAEGDCSHKFLKKERKKENYNKPRQHIKTAETSVRQQRSVQSNLWFFQ